MSYKIGDAQTIVVAGKITIRKLMCKTLKTFQPAEGFYGPLTMFYGLLKLPHCIYQHLYTANRHCIINTRPESAGGPVAFYTYNSPCFCKL